MLNNPKYRGKPLFADCKSQPLNYYKIGFNLSSINTKVISYTPIHLSRHTFASMSLCNNVSIEVISKMLGHSDIKTTQIYAKMQDQAVYDGMATMQSKFNTLQII